MFDVRPIGKSGGLDFEKISYVKTEINLRKRSASPFPVKPILIEHQIARSQIPVVKKETRPLPPPAQVIDSKYVVLREFEKTFAEPLDPTVELARMGAKIRPLIKREPAPRFVVREEKEKPVVKVAPIKSDSADFKSFLTYLRPVAVTRPVKQKAVLTTGPTPASREMDFWLTRLGPMRLARLSVARPICPESVSLEKTKGIWSRPKFLAYLSGFILAGLFLGLIIQGGIGARNNIIQNGSNAAANLEEAKQKLEDLKFADAANNFALAYDDLDRASNALNELGASFLSVFGNLPGLKKINAANNLVKAGQNISKAGENLALALGTFYNSNPFSLLNASPTSSSKSLPELLSEFKTVLVDANSNIKKANNLLADIDGSVIPEDKQPLLLDFKEKIPQFLEYIGGAIDYSDFLLKFIGSNNPRTYLVLLQNNSELRPTGGFPGTYALIAFEDGYLKNIFVDDIYKIDANLKENIVPPLQMQHITPTWGMRDANWFTDFPASARKVEEFYQKDGGEKVDGVLAITPDLIAEILKITGPIDMPEYELKLDAGNFLAEIQNEVEYEADRTQPKRILADLQPRFFEKLGSQDKNNWLEIFNIILKAVEEKHILAYFNDSSLQKVTIENGFGGEIKQTPSTGSTGSPQASPGQMGDYLQVVFANIKGSKTDLVTDTSFDLETSLTGDGDMEHELKISRLHNGGDSQYRFYNRDNSAYVKVFVPEGSVLESIIGQSITDFKPLISYEGFKHDPDLERIEGGVSHPVAGADVFEESGKTVFGFWLVVKPKETKSVILKYRTSVAETAVNDYSLYWQKQSGTSADQIKFSFKLPDGASIANQSPDLQRLGDNLILNSDLSIDREIDINLK